MKRILIGLILGLILSMVLSTSALAKGPPKSIVIHAGQGGKPMFDLTPNDGVPPSDVYIIKRDGEIMHPGPPDKGSGTGY